MPHLDGASFLAHPHKALTFLGVSGCGKTRLSTLFQRDAWFHYSIDYRIGTRYLTDPILDVVKRRMMADPVLAKLLKTDSIWLSHNITIENLTAVSDYIGKLGTRGGGLPREAFETRQHLYAAAEKLAVADLPYFIQRAEDIYSYPHFIHDTSGSLCEIVSGPASPLWGVVVAHTLPIYIRVVGDGVEKIIKRQLQTPKPVYYHPAFLEKALREFGHEFGAKAGDFECDFEPDAFIRFIFPSLLEHRDVAYQNLVADSGLTMDSDTLEGKTTGEEVLDCIAAQLDRTPVPVPQAWTRRPSGLDAALSA